MTHPAEPRPGNLARYLADRSFTEADLRRMLEHATGYRQDIVEGHWVIMVRHERRPWEVVVEPDDLARLLVVVIAYQVGQ